MRLIPERPRKEANKSETRLFEAFEGLALDKNWTVVHSIKIGTSSDAIFGEADFFVFVPGRGIVTIEAKAPTSVERKSDGSWYLEGTPKPNKNPLEQADKARAALRKHLKDFGFSENIPLPRLIWFTSLNRHQFDPKPIKDFEFHEWELAWKQDLSKPVETIDQVLDRFLENYQGSKKIRHTPEVLTENLTDAIVDSLFVQFKVALTREELAEERRKEREALFQEQKDVIDQLESNPHIYIEGAAGTGKSRILREIAIRSRKEEKRTLLTCWSRMMGEEHANGFSTKDMNFLVKDINQIMLDFAGISENPPNADSAWFQEELPKRAIEGLRRMPHLGNYSAILVDEFQDFIDKIDVLKFLLMLSKNQKVSDTRIVLAGDENQKILVDQNQDKSGFEIIRFLISDTIKWQLNSNWRMNPKLHKEMLQYLQMKLPVTKHRLDENVAGGLTVLETTEEKAIRTLYEVLEALLKKYSPKEIRVLSPFGKTSLASSVFESRADSKEIRWLRQNLRHEQGPGEIRWRSISKFKGLESEVVVLTDFGSRSSKFYSEKEHSEKQALYTGISRAREECVLLNNIG